jgi:hypothetical protein
MVMSGGIHEPDERTDRKSTPMVMMDHSRAQPSDIPQPALATGRTQPFHRRAAR